MLDFLIVQNQKSFFIMHGIYYENRIMCSFTEQFNPLISRQMATIGQWYYLETVIFA